MLAQIVADPEFFQTITTVGSAIGIASPIIFGIMYLLNQIDMSNCTGSGKTVTQCSYYDGMLSSSKFALLATALSAPMRIFQVWLTTAPTQDEEHWIGGDRYVQLISGLDSVFQGVLLLSLFVTFVSRGISNFLGGTSNIFFDLFVMLLSAIQLTADVSYLVYLQKVLNVI